MTASLLIEIGVEELPPLAMQPLAKSLADNLHQQLEAAGIECGAATYYATPRRLTAHLKNTSARSPDVTIEKQGPTLAIAYDEHGNPSKAGEGFARSVGLTIDQLEVEDSSKGRRLVYRGVEAGQPLSELLQPAVDATLQALPIPKRMRWGDRPHAFVRPVHWVVALHGDQVVPLTVFDEPADRVSRGHRFHHPDSIAIHDADHYLAPLKDTGWVVADIEERTRQVRDCVTTAAHSLAGRALMDDTLVDEVVALVEWPVGIAGHFDTRYLELPREVLIATLEGHQRYFPVEDDSGQLMAGFVTVANIESRDPAQVVAGNERVIHPRLADALFFWQQDRQRTLASRVDDLERVSFQQTLGSMGDKSRRVTTLAGKVAEAAGADAGHAERAATLAKTDLLTLMVDEFPELQGIMGGYYAALENEPEAVHRALPGQYSPSGGGAPIAETATGRSIALADRLDTLAGIFAINKRPSGDKDPFGLRRAALGVLRTLIESDIRLDLKDLLRLALQQQPVTADKGTLDALWQFHVERLKGYYSDQGVPTPHFESIASLDISNMRDFDQRLKAVGTFMQLPEASVVCASHKRIRNILKRNADASIADSADAETMTETAEKDLHDGLRKVSQQLSASVAQGDYSAALKSLAALAQPLDRFFETVMVMTDDADQQRNRLALLDQVDQVCRWVADISCLSTEAS